MSYKKRVIAGAAVVAAMAMGLAGCGSDSNDIASKDSSDGGVVNITYMHRLPDGDGMVLVNDIVAKWNKEHPNIQVKATKFDGKASEMIKKLETDVKSDTAPDLAQIGYSELPEVFTKGMLQDVTEYAEQYKDHFASGPYGLMQVNGKSYGLPQDTGPLTYFYNKTEFDKLGISVPKTADELIETAKKTAAQGKYIMSFQPDEAMMTMSGQAGASGAWYTIEGDAWKVDTQTDGSKAVADVYQQLLDAKAATTNQRWDASFDASLQDGSLIGTVAAAWEAPLFMSSAGEASSGQWQVTQIGDWFGNGTKTGADGGSGVAVLKTSKHPKEAMEFLDWFNTQVPDLVSQGLVVAATTEDAETPEDWATFFGGQDIMSEFKTANANMSDFIYIPGFSAVGAKMNETAAKVVDGSAKVSDIFADAQTTSVATLKDLKLSVKE
ncbi:ABC transporter substrate-binding protein [Bifidobacterium rousetti]|uniref:ABC transporter substrate-binding protein n=1 Tax=Bifidobacterium rousetti TaxID=2045439 RepID=UPI000D140EFA|nr:extracellular solute-binding protein [Bifidobacterium rousetti]KAA8819673.1 ABC transporter substrate-binding protein [Bifidobacterium rousetti]PST47907.1 ABC transporter substrate-binding protein [Bifidobacterium callitrichos]